MNVQMHGYGKSNHDLSYITKFNACPGALIPFTIEPTLMGEDMSTVLRHLIRTLPTNGPAFLSYKVQMDMFWVPIRLYNAQLHNNRLHIGMNLDQVQFPLMQLRGPIPNPKEASMNSQQINPTSLMHYLGISGLGRSGVTGATEVVAKFQAMTMLAYADIYKNWYANKQEGEGAVITSTGEDAAAVLTGGEVTQDGSYIINRLSASTLVNTPNNNLAPGEGTSILANGTTSELLDTSGIMPQSGSGPLQRILTIGGYGLNKTNVYAYFGIAGTGGTSKAWRTIKDIEDDTSNPYYFTIASDNSYIACQSSIAGSSTQKFWNEGIGGPIAVPVHNKRAFFATGDAIIRSVEIKKFPLENIDLMRDTILQKSIESPLIIGPGTGEGVAADDAEWKEPYASFVGTTANPSPNLYELNGLLLKTYQNDRFQTWLDTEWIEGPAGISAITAIDTSSGSFTLDSLNLAQHLYNNLNRIAAAGGTYTDYLETAYGQRARRLCEAPEFRGSVSAEITFEEVISMADSTGPDGTDQPLGSLAGRGTTRNERGGRIRIGADEHGFMIGIFSITPRLDYSQGNKWFNRWRTLRDIHMPELDGIGYQELITDEFAAFDTIRDANGDPITASGDTGYKSIGKQPAWQEYRTNQNEVHGDFTPGRPLDFMVNNRDYAHDPVTGALIDTTTYVDPTKYSRVFASSELPDTAWAWVQLGIDTKARRIMSNKIIPNL